MVNRNPYVPPEDRADYLKSSIVNEAPKPATVARKPAAKPAHKAPVKRRK
ncbi:hypothetical protein [Janthinobacterium sp. Ant5-2-1]|nr:hypothetical protein [Janthinobacterium sp. Ant5-2-1]